MIQIDLKSIIIIVLILLGIGGYYYHLSKTDKLKDKIELGEKLSAALTDTVRTYKNKHGQVVSEKKTLQADLNKLLKDNITLTVSQAALVNQIKKTEKEKQTISAALIETTAKLRDYENSTPIAIDSSSVRFAENSDSISYDLTVRNIQPLPNKIPSLTISSLEIPNTLFVDFSWGDKKEGYPVSVSVINSNPLFQTNNIESFIIPQITKEELDPNFWQKLSKFPKTTVGGVTIFFGGVATGIIILSR